MNVYHDDFSGEGISCQALAGNSHL